MSTTFNEYNGNKAIELFLESDESSNFEIGEIDNELSKMNLKRIYPSHCNICDRIHDSDENNYLFLKDEEGDLNLHMSCSTNKTESKFIGRIPSRMPDYSSMSEDELKRRREKFANLFFDLKHKYPGIYISFPNFDYDPIEDIHHRYEIIVTNIVKCNEESKKNVELVCKIREKHEYASMSDDEIKEKRQRFTIIYDNLLKTYPKWNIKIPDLENEPLEDIHSKYEETIEIIMKYNDMVINNPSIEPNKETELFRDMDGLFPEDEIIFDYTSGFLAEIVLLYIMSDANKINSNEFINNLISKYGREKSRKEVEKIILGAILYIVTWLFISSKSEIKDTLIDNELLSIETADIEIVSKSSKTIVSDIFKNEDGTPFSNGVESSKEVKLITKITIKNKNSIWEIISKMTPYPEASIPSVTSVDSVTSTDQELIAQVPVVSFDQPTQEIPVAPVAPIIMN